MTAIWALTAQAIMISIAYPTACLAAAAFATLATAGLAPAEIAGDWHTLANLVAAVAALWWVALVSAFWPGMVAAALTEGLKLRGVMAYLVGGCVVGLVRALPIGSIVAGRDIPPVDTPEAQLSVAAGAVAGFVYWLIAGRSAGRWLDLRWFEPSR